MSDPHPSHANESYWSGPISWPAQHPATAVLLAAVLALFALLAIRRIKADASIGSMLARDDPAASAMLSVLNNFSAVDELLVLVSIPPSQPPAAHDTQRLIAYADSFDAAVKASPEAAGLCKAVVYRPDAQMRQFFERVVVPSGLLYLDEANFEAARHRLTRGEMAKQLAHNEAMISAPGPVANSLASALLQDPLRLHEFLLAQLNRYRPGGGADAFVSPDGRSLLIRVIGSGSTGDLEFSRQITSVMSELANRLNTHGLEIDITGGYAIAAASERAIRRDMIASVISSVIFLQILFVVAYRRPVRSFILAMAPVALGILLGFGVRSMFTTTLSPATAVVGGILAGLGVDYSVIYLSHYYTHLGRHDRSADAARHTTAALTPALVAACATSVIGFLAIGRSDVPALRDFSVLGALGLIGSLIATFWLAPAMLVLAGRDPATVMQVRLHVEPLLIWIARHRNAMIGLSIATLLVCVGVIAASGGWLPLESDLTVMHPRPNPPLQAQAKVAARMGTDPGSLLIHLRASSPDELLILAHRVDHALRSPAARQAGVVGTFGLAALLPDPRMVPARLNAVTPEETRQIVSDFRAVVADSSFSAEAYEPYSHFLEQILTIKAAPTIADLLPYRTLADSVLSKQTVNAQPGAASEAITLIFLDRPLDQRPQRSAAVTAIRTALADIPGATLTGLSVIQFDSEQSIRRDLPRLLGLAGGLIALYLLLHFRSVGDTLLATVPALFSMAWLLALMHVLEQKLNMMNLIAIPLLMGITVDYGIFLVSLARRSMRAQTDLTEGLASSCHAVCVSAFANTFGFGSLALTSVPAIRSLGWAVGVGVGACLVGSFFLLAPLLIVLAERKRTR